MTPNDILAAIDEDGVITWWPGGPSHDAVAQLEREGKISLRDCSTSQETVYEVRRADSPEDTQ